MWTRFCLRVLSASVFLKPLAEASSPWRNTIPLVNASTPSSALFSHPGGASGAGGSATWATSEVALYTSAHQSTRVSTSRWPSPGDAHTAASIGRGQAVDSATAVWCSRGGDTGPCSLPATAQPITAASPPASRADSATPSSSTNERGEIFAETAAQEEGTAAASASPALSITPADPAITPAHAGGPRPDSQAATLQYTLPAPPPPISPVLPVTPGGPTRTGSSLGLAFPSVNSSSAVAVSSPTESSVAQSPPQTPAPLSIASTATSSRFASASTVKSAAEASSADGSEPSSSLTAPSTFSFPPHASAASSSVAGNGVAAPLANSSASSTNSNFTLAAASTFIISPSMALSFGSNTALSPSFPTVFTSGASPSGPSLNPSVPTLSPSMPDNTILPTPTDAFSPDSSSIFVCGGSPFQPSEYTCYDDSTLCPVQGGGRLEACGGSCYDPGLYGCVDDGLQPIVGGKLPNGMTPSHTIAVPATEWPSSAPTPMPSTASRTSSQPSSSTSRSSSSTLSTSTTSSSSSTSSSASSTPSSTSSSSSASATASSSSTAAPAPSDDSDNLSTNQIAAIAASTSSAFILFAVAGLFLYRRHQRNRASPAPQQYPELAYLYDPPVPGSGNASRGGGLEGGPTGPFGVGGPDGAGAGSAAAWSGATLSALGATLRGGGGSNSTNSSGSSVSLVGPAGRPPVMGAAGAAASASAGSGSGSSNAALLAASSTGGRGTPTRGAGDGNTMAPSPSRADESGDEGRPFLTAGGAVAGSSGASSRERSVERGTSAGEQQQQHTDGTSTWDEIDRELGARLHEKQVEETRQRRELARAFLLQAKERQEQRIPLLSRGDASGASGAGAGAGVGAAGAAAAGAALFAGAAAASRSRHQQQPHQSPSQRQQQWWQTSPSTSPPPAPPSPPAAAHQTATPAYHPIYPPISPTYPVSGPILTSQHIEHNRLQQAQHARAASRNSNSPPASPVNGPTYPSFHRPRPSYPPPSAHWSNSREGAYAQLSGGRSSASPPPFQQNTAYAPPHHRHRSTSNGLGFANAAGGVYTTIPEEPSHAPQGSQQSLHQIMQHMNALDEEDSDDGASESGRFLSAPRRVLSVRNGAVTPSSDGGSYDGDEGGVEERRRWADDGGRRNLI